MGITALNDATRLSQAADTIERIQNKILGGRRVTDRHIDLADDFLESVQKLVYEEDENMKEACCN